MKKRFLSKKTLALLLAVLTLAALLPINAMAAIEDCPDCDGGTTADGVACQTCGGSGTIGEADPVCGHCGGSHETSACTVWCATCDTTDGTHPNSACSHYVAPTIDCAFCEGSDNGHTTNDCPNSKVCDNENCTAYHTRVPIAHECTLRAATPKCSVCNGDLAAGASCTHAVTFKNGETVLDTVAVDCGAGATAPGLPSGATGWDKAFAEVKSDLTVSAVFPATETVDPTEDTVIVPETINNDFSADTEEDSGDAAEANPDDETLVSVRGNISWPTLPSGVAKPTLTITLRRDGDNIQTFKTKKNTYAFTDLPKTDGNGHAYVYSIKVAKHPAANFTAALTGKNIAISYTAPADNTQGTNGGNNSDSESDASNKTSFTGYVRWNGLPNGTTGTVRVILTQNGVTHLSTEVTGNSTQDFTFTDIDINDDNGVAYAYSIAADPLDVDGYTHGEPVITPGAAYEVAVTYQQDAALVSLAEQFAALIEALPSAADVQGLLEALMATEDAAEADRISALLENYMGVYEAAGDILGGLSGEGNERAFHALVGATLMDKYTALGGENALGFNAGMALLAVPTKSITATITFRTLAASTSIPTGDHPITLVCTEDVTKNQTATISVTDGTVKTYSHKFTGLDETDTSGRPYTYTIDWPAATPTGYIALKNATNLVYQEVGTSSAKIIISAEFQSGTILPEPPAGTSITTTVVGVSGVSATLSKAAGWSKTFSPVTLTAGSALSLSPAPATVSGYYAPQVTQTITGSGSSTSDPLVVTFKIYYQLALNARTISGNVVWRDKDNNVISPAQAVTVSLYLTDAVVTGKRNLYSTVTVPTDDSTFTFGNIPDADINGNELRAGLEATAVSGYTVAVDGTTITYWKNDYSRTNLQVKVNWSDSQNKRGVRPTETTVYLYRGSEYVDAKQVGDATNWTVTFPHLDRTYANGKLCYYSVRAAKVARYYASPVHANGSNAVTLTYRYGSGSYGDTTTTTSSGLTPKVGDPTVFKTRLSENMYAEASASAARLSAIAWVGENENATGTVDFDALKRINPDVVGWISLEGTALDNPIVKGNNNTEYLTRLFSGEANSAGTLFMDYHNNSKFNGRNTVVYGHNMKDGTMFAVLHEYEQQSFYTAHTAMKLQTPSGKFTIEPVAGFSTDDAYSNVVKRTFANNAAFMAYVDQCIRASIFQSTATVSATDKLITFVTCNNDYNDGKRFVLVCKLSPEA